MSESFSRETINKNLRKTDFKQEDVEKDILNQIMYHEEAALELRRQAGMFNTIYIPQIHSAHAASMLRKDRRILWTENIPPMGKKSGKRHYGTIEGFSPIYKDEMEKEIDAMYLHEMNYTGEPYMKIKMIIERNEPMVQVTGNSEYSILNKLMNNQ